MINPGVFSSNYEVYVISTPQASARVSRRRSAFVELRELLTKQFPGFVAPPVPKKPIKNLKPKFLEKRRGKLQLFLNDLLDHPLFKQTDAVWNFLNITDDKSYEKIKAGYCIPRDISEFTTVEGKAKVSFDPELDNDCTQTNNVLKSIAGEFKKYYVLSICSLRKYNTELSKTLTMAMDIMGKMSKSYTAISELYGVAEAHELSDVFKKLGKSFNLAADPLNKLKDSLETDIQKYLRYYNKELALLGKQFKNLSDKKAQYLALSKSIRKKKESLFAEGKPEKWRLAKSCLYSYEILLQNKELAFSEMLEPDMMILAKMHRFCGYFLHKTDEECKRIFAKNGERFREHFAVLGKLYGHIFEQVFSGVSIGTFGVERPGKCTRSFKPTSSNS
eukprot:TRINITY_DN3052_c0_g1_i4.p1 TRINITY_DN3052_c0_g1~~TRINITY_DN3052_c0_g1_i4.p1  ORF type:complete len:390 (-),score=87.18 TRINITY_DN3052_c0_g1_i4:157-1326(-)